MHNPDLSTNTHLTQLTGKQLLVVKGPEAGKFLQGQVTCDINELGSQVTRIGAQCNPKGRMLMSFRALQMDSETIALRLPASMIESASKSLGKYIVFSKAKIQPPQSSFTLFGLFGCKSQAIAQSFFGATPAALDGWIEHEGSYLIQLEPNRFECWIKADSVGEFLSQSQNQTQPADEHDWQLLDIAAGIADIYPETYELFTPQELNYQLVNGVNFRKGCYTGQEIVARLHYRGKLKRHMYRFSLSASAAPIPAPGSTVVSSLNQQPVGHVVIASKASSGKFECLVSTLDEHRDQLRIETFDEKLNLLALPYAIPTSENAPV